MEWVDSGSAPGTEAGRRPIAGGLVRLCSDWRPSLVTAAVAVVAFRVVTLLLAVVAAHGLAGWHLLLQRPADALFLPFDHWDTNWWGSVAANGYGHTDPGGFSDAAFAPAYPMSMRAVMWLLHVDPLAAGFLVSGIALFVALAVLHRLAAEDHGLGAARATVLLVLLWPTAAFLAAPYSESLSLALVALTLLAARRERWLWAGALAALAMLSKYVLGLLVVVLVVDHVVRRRRRGEPPQARALAALVLPGALALAGVMVFMQARFGAPLDFLAAEARAWGHRLGSPTQLVLNSQMGAIRYRATHDWDRLRALVLDDATIVSLLLLAAAALRRRPRRPAGVALLGFVAVTFACMSLPDSASRYALVLAPMFLLLGPALARRRALLAGVLGCSAALMVLELFTFTTGGWAG